MKRHFYILAALLITLSACETMIGEGDDDGPIQTAKYVRFTNTEVNLAATGEDKGYNFVEFRKATWEISDFPSWVTVTPKSGGSTTDYPEGGSDNVIFKASANNSINERTGSFTLKSTTKGYTFSKTYTIIQDGAKPYIKVINPETNQEYGFYEFNDGEQAEYPGHVSLEGGTYTMKVITNTPDKLKCTFANYYNMDGEPSYSYNKQTGILSVTFPPISSFDTRALGLTIYIGNAGEEDYTCKYINFCYELPNFSWYSPEGQFIMGDNYTQPINAPCEGGDYIIKIGSNIPDYLISIWRTFVASNQWNDTNIDITYDKPKQQIIVNFPKNDSSSARDIDIHVYIYGQGDYYYTTQITQNGVTQ